jgi:hypothetical protein
MLDEYEELLEAVLGLTPIRQLFMGDRVLVTSLTRWYRNTYSTTNKGLMMIWIFSSYCEIEFKQI